MSSNVISPLTWQTVANWREEKNAKNDGSPKCIQAIGQSVEWLGMSSRLTERVHQCWWHRWCVRFYLRSSDTLHNAGHDNNAQEKPFYSHYGPTHDKPFRNARGYVTDISAVIDRNKSIFLRFSVSIFFSWFFSTAVRDWMTFFCLSLAECQRCVPACLFQRFARHFKVASRESLEKDFLEAWIISNPPRPTFIVSVILEWMLETSKPHCFNQNTSDEWLIPSRICLKATENGSTGISMVV